MYKILRSKAATILAGTALNVIPAGSIQEAIQ
jgi:hypothetical protein